MSQNMFLRAFVDLFQLAHYIVAFIARALFLIFHEVRSFSFRIGRSEKTVPILIVAQFLCAYVLGFAQYRDLIRRVFNDAEPNGKDTLRFEWFDWFTAPAKALESGNLWVVEKLTHHKFPTLPGINHETVGMICVGITVALVWAVFFSKPRSFQYGLMYLVATLGITGIILGAFTYAPYAMYLESVSSLLAWVLVLFVGSIEEFANVVTDHFCQGNSQHEGTPNAQFCDTTDNGADNETKVVPQRNTAFDLARSYALTATWLSLIGIFGKLLMDVKTRLAVHFASCVDVVVGDDITAIRLARHMVADNQRPWRFEDWHRPDMRWPSATLDGRFSRLYDLDRILARPRIVLLITSQENKATKAAAKSGVIVLDRDLTDTKEIRSLMTSRALMLRNLSEGPEVWSQSHGLPPRRIRLRRLYVVTDNPERNQHIIHQTRSVFKEVACNLDPILDDTKQPAVVTVHGGVPRVILRLDSASESRSWVTTQLAKYQSDPQGVPWLLDAVNTEEASAASIRSRLTYNPDRRRRRLTEQDAQHLIIVGSSPLTMALVDEIAWARQQAYELLRGEIRCYTRLIKDSGSHMPDITTDQLEEARELRVRQLDWLLSKKLSTFAKKDESGSAELPRPKGYKQGELYWPFPHSERLEIPALQSIRLVGCDEQMEHLATNTQFQSKQTPGLEEMLDKVPHPASTSCGGHAMAGNWIRQPQEHGKNSGLWHEDVLDKTIPQRIWIGENRIEPWTVRGKESLQLRPSFPVARGADLLLRAEADLRHILGLSSTDHKVSKAGEPIPSDEHVVVVFTEDTKWSHDMAHLIMAKRPDYTAVLVRDPAVQGVHRPNAPDLSAASPPGGCVHSSSQDSTRCDSSTPNIDNAFKATAKPKQVARYGPSWVSGRHPIDDLWTRLARQNHNLALSVHLEEVPANAYRRVGACAAGCKDCSQAVAQSGSVFHRVGAYFRSVLFDTADAERGLASRTPWHESPYADEPDLDKDADQASRRYRTRYLEQLPEFFREEQYHRLSRTILNVQSSPQYQWDEVLSNDTGDNGIPQHITHPDQLQYLVQQDHDGWHEFRSKFGWVHGGRHSDYNREHHAMKSFNELLRGVARPQSAGSSDHDEDNLRLAWVTMTRTLNRLYALGLVVAPQGDLRQLSEQPSSSDADDPAEDQNHGEDTSDVDGKKRR